MGSLECPNIRGTRYTKLYQNQNLDMHTTYHLSSAEEVSNIVDSIISVYKSKAITITVEDDDDSFELTDDIKEMLDERLMEDESTYLTAEQSISQLKSKYGL